MPGGASYADGIAGLFACQRQRRGRL